MDLNTGDVLLTLNGHRIYSKEAMEEILYFRPNYIWVDVFDIEKGLITKEYKDYQKGIRTLGLVVVSNSSRYGILVEEAKSPLRRWISKYKKKKARFRN